MKDGNQSRYASDEDILTLYNRRDEQAIAATQSKYGSYCRAVADRILRGREDAEECVNDAYLHAWNAIPPARPGSLRAFLGAIVRNLAINRLNYNRARRRNAAIVALDEFAECLPDGIEPITDTVALRAAFDSFLASLPERERVIFVRRYWYLCPVAEIARGMDIPEGTVKSILSRTRERFRIHLEKEGIFV